MRDPRQNQAEACLIQLTELDEQHDEKALPLLQQAMLLYAEAYRVALTEQGVSTALTRTRADVCQRYGDLLTRHERHAEAANVFQEAVDLYGQLLGEADRQQAKVCAQKALASVAALNAHPRNRLYLLIARHERQRQQLALQAGTEAQQGDCCLHIAQILLRRDRPEEAYTRYAEALELYRQAEPSDTVYLAQAECHHRLGNLLANVMVAMADSAEQAELDKLDEASRVARAIEHYSAALALCRQYEPAVYGVQERAELAQNTLAELQERQKDE